MEGSMTTAASRSVVSIAFAMTLVLAGCAGAPTSVTAPPATAPSTAAALASESASATTRLPSYAPGESLYAYNRFTGEGGGLFVAHPDGSGLTRLATDVLPGVLKP